MHHRRRLISACCAGAAVAALAHAGIAGADIVPGNQAFGPFETRSLDGTGNNPRHPSWGAAGSAYLRVAPAAYADGVSAQRRGPNARYVSNRIFNDVGQNIFSERDMSQWAWVWGQFIDHTLGLAKAGTETDNIATSTRDPLETFSNDRG